MPVNWTPTGETNAFTETYNLTKLNHKETEKSEQTDY